MNKIKSWIFWIGAFSWLAFFAAGWEIYSGRYDTALWAIGTGAWMRGAILAEKSMKAQQELIEIQRKLIEELRGGVK